MKSMKITPKRPVQKSGYTSVVDTRAGGAAAKLGPFASRSFGIHGNMTSQGGTTCNNPNFDPGAVALTITITEQEGSGYATVYPHGASLPNSSTINYRAGIDTANSTIVGSAISAGTFNDIRVFNNGRSHVIIDIVGYFAAPERTALDIQTVSTVEAHTGTFSFTSPICPTGYTFSSAGHSWSSGFTDVWFWQVARNGNAQQARCRGNVDRGGSSSNISCSATCLRIPGR